MSTKTIHNYINGELVAPISNQYIDVINPATAEIYAQLADSNEQDVELAYKAAANAFSSWSTCTTEKRSQILLRIADLILINLDKLALAESIDNGKPLQLAKTVDIPRAAANFHFFGTAILHFSSESHFMEEGAINYTLRQPLGVVGCISPWNLPLYLFTWKIAPALAAGNCVVAKPSEITPMTAFLLSEICIEAGLPKGVLNIVHGYGNKVGNAIVSHPKITAISFTGGTQTGAAIAKIAEQEEEEADTADTVNEEAGNDQNATAGTDTDIIAETDQANSDDNQNDQTDNNNSITDGNQEIE